MYSPVIKWSGSKRSQAEQIINYAPSYYGTYYEPFVGGGSVLYALKPEKAICGDICESLIALWNEIKDNPTELAKSYEQRWQKLQDEGYTIFYKVRDNYNQHHNPEDLMFLSRTCVNGLIRFNSKGDFNNSYHLTRPGIAPDRLKKIIFNWSDCVQNTNFIAGDYRKTSASAKEGDLVYLDPPYFHTKGRYYGAIDFNDFVKYLEGLNRKGVKYMLSFDGTRGNDKFIVDMPHHLYKRHEMIPSGNSSFKKVMNKEKQPVYESLYLNW